MALIDNDELFDDSTTQTDSTVTEPAATAEDNSVEQPKEEPKYELPEKYRNKSVEDIVKMHQEAEKLIGRQAQEVHEVRSLADQLLKQQLEASKAGTKPIEESQDEDFFVDPKAAVKKTVEQHPAVIEAQKIAADVKKMHTAQKLAAKHPDFQTIASDTGFQDWVKASQVRLNLYAKADAEFDFDSADELISTYKELKAIQNTKAQTVDKSVEQAAQDKAMKAATVDVGGTVESSQKIYRRADLIRLRMNDPDRYMAMENEIINAYAEGRVR